MSLHVCNGERGSDAHVLLELEISIIVVDDQVEINRLLVTPMSRIHLHLRMED